jgi:hypothetical protein
MTKETDMQFRSPNRGNIAAAATAIALAAAAIPLYVSAQEVTPKHTAEEIKKAKPSATIEVEAAQLRLIVGGAQGRGTLHFKGKSFPFTMKGGTVGGVGATKVTATGDVYFLENVADFAGNYSAATLGAALGPGFGGSQYENNKGVFINVRSKTEGVGLNLGLGVVSITLVQ